ncbi:unnamed protein product, partial [Didymodactylos carnosus]
MPQNASFMASNDISRKLNVLVVGETGTGKSSVINMIFDNESMTSTSGKATGCTTECEVVRGYPPGSKSLYLTMFDTVGVCESSEGIIPTKIALEESVAGR